MKPTPYYDDPSFDYHHYWRTRHYENQAEKIALQKLLALVPTGGRAADLGAGFGRLTGCYRHHFKQCFLVDSSAKMLALAKKHCRQKNLHFVKAFVEKLPFKAKYLDAVIIVRTFHHLKDSHPALEEIRRVLKPGGWLILEFANKIHFKARIKAWLRGDFEFISSLRPIRVGKRHKQQVPFLNYHPQHVNKLLKKHHFQIIKTLSVSNLRNPVCKKLLPLKWLLWLEKVTQRLYTPLFTGPSIFVLAQKTKK